MKEYSSQCELKSLKTSQDDLSILEWDHPLPPILKGWRKRMIT